MSAMPLVCPRCGHSDVIVKVTSPEAPRVLPTGDTEIAQAGHSSTIHSWYGRIIADPLPALQAVWWRYL